MQEKARAIHTRLKRTAEDIIAIGQDLIAVKTRLGHGQFKPWLLSEFDMSYPTAVRFMQVGEKFSKNINLIHLPVSVLYELAAPSTPETVIEMVENGEIEPTISAVREAKHEAKQAEQPQEPKTIEPELEIEEDELPLQGYTRACFVLVCWSVKAHLPLQG